MEFGTVGGERERERGRRVEDRTRCEEARAHVRKRNEREREREMAMEVDEEACGVLVCEGLPSGVTIVVDHREFGVSPGQVVHGVRDLCVGAHFCATVCAAGQFPSGFFFIVEREGHVVVRKWDSEDECLKECETKEDADALAFRVTSCASYASKMLRYDKAWREPWRDLTGHITRDTIARVSPVGKVISVLGEPDGTGGTFQQSDHEKRLEEQLQVGRDSAPASSSPAHHSRRCKCFYVEVPRKLDSKGLTGRDLTLLYLDKTRVLEDVVETKLGGRYEELLGELEFAFVAFAMCQSLAGFQQWKQLTCLLLGCEEAPLTRVPDIYYAFLRTLRSQIALTEGESGHPTGGLVDDLLGDESTGGLGCVGKAIRDFAHMVREADLVSEKLELEVTNLLGGTSLRGLDIRNHGSRKHGRRRSGGQEEYSYEAKEWEDDDEDAPTIVVL